MRLLTMPDVGENKEITVWTAIKLSVTVVTQAKRIFKFEGVLRRATCMSLSDRFWPRADCWFDFGRKMRHP